MFTDRLYPVISPRRKLIRDTIMYPINSPDGSVKMFWMGVIVSTSIGVLRVSSQYRMTMVRCVARSITERVLHFTATYGIPYVE